MTYQDIHLADEALWQQIIQLYQSGQYAEAIQTIQNTNLSFKVLNANSINNLTNFIVTVENLSDPTFKQNNIPCQSTQPTSQNTGEVWFQITQ